MHSTPLSIGADQARVYDLSVINAGRVVDADGMSGAGRPEGKCAGYDAAVVNDRAGLREIGLDEDTRGNGRSVSMRHAARARRCESTDKAIIGDLSIELITICVARDADAYRQSV